jgi:hypothetical protein
MMPRCDKCLNFQRDYVEKKRETFVVNKRGWIKKHPPCVPTFSSPLIFWTKYITTFLSPHVHRYVTVLPISPNLISQPYSGVFSRLLLYCIRQVIIRDLRFLQQWKFWLWSFGLWNYRSF